MPLRLDRSSADFDEQFAKFLDAKREVSADVELATRTIVDDVADRGDAALIEATRKFDRVEPDATGLRVSAAESDAAAKACGVAKIVGPGNAYVAAAKRLVFGKVGIDMIAGPSEVLVIADDTGNADWIAADLLAQAEHDTSAQSILITCSSRLADEVARAVQSQLSTLPRADIARASWNDFGAI